MGRRNLHTRAQIRELALNAARSIVMQEGAAALSTRRIARAIGYTAGSLYLTFTNLEDLVRQINNTTLAALRDRIKDAAAESDDPVAGLVAMTEAYIRFAAANAGLWQLAFGNTRPQEWWVAHGEVIEEMFSLVERWLRRLAPATSTDDLRRAAHALWRGIHGTCVLTLTDDPDEASEQQTIESARLLLTHFLAGFKVMSAAATEEVRR